MWNKEEFHTMGKIRSALVSYHCGVLRPEDLDNNSRKEAFEQCFFFP